ncbi:MAG TPA: hypothetical protein VIK14_03170 [Ignavibacteria bacterium]
MKKIHLTIGIAVFILVCLTRMQAQTTQTKLNQVELMKQFIGTWQSSVGKDSVDVREWQNYGKAFMMITYQLVKGQKGSQGICNIGFDPEEGNFKGFKIGMDGHYVDWIGSFTTEKTFTINGTKNLKPGPYGKYTFTFESPDIYTTTNYNKDGVIIWVHKFTKVK